MNTDAVPEVERRRPISNPSTKREQLLKHKLLIEGTTMGDPHQYKVPVDILFITWDDHFCFSAKKRVFKITVMVSHSSEIFTISTKILNTNYCYLFWATATKTKLNKIISSHTTILQHITNFPCYHSWFAHQSG